MRHWSFLFILFFTLTTISLVSNEAYASRWARSYGLTPAITQPIPVSNLADYDQYSANVKDLIAQSSSLTKQKLTYLFGSANPKNGGMDCSGTIYYLLSNHKNIDVPRQANGMYAWVKKSGKLHTVNTHNFDSAQFNKLKPGDLLFWSGTYKMRNKNSITHVMLYLGKNKNDEPLMFGASGGRTYAGKRMNGVSVFDFVLPSGKGKAKFVGYGCIPGVTCDRS